MGEQGLQGIVAPVVAIITVICTRYVIKQVEHARDTLFFYKNDVIPVQAEYSYFSADFRLKIFLYYS